MTQALLAAESATNLTAFEHPAWLWPAFLVFVVVLLMADLFVFHREAHDIGMREAGVTSAAWIALGVAFTGVVWMTLGSDAAVQYIT
ncbi:MAG: hypothetical protein OEW30_21145, partial [Acidimicrobiia bacterium]|nr:hypothetical protein [Acidimicrobiia bacterium]